MGENERVMAVAEVAAVLRGIGVPADVGSRDDDTRHAADMILDVNGRQLPVHIEMRATVSAQQADTLVRAADAADDTARIVVADRVVSSARERLRDAGWGWFDRRGHIRISGPGVLLDASVPRSGLPNVGSSDPLTRTVVREVAAWSLGQPEAPLGVRALARSLNRAPSSVSDALGALSEQGLITQEQGPLLPELFWELADRWATPRLALATTPEPGAGGLIAQLHLGLDDIEHTTGWVLTDTLAAVAYGAPVGARSGTPPDFFVPSKQIERLASMALGTASHRDRACTVRAAPVPWACQQRVDGAVLDAETRWPLAHPLFVALDLSTDRGRGREILESWTPPAPWRRVW